MSNVSWAGACPPNPGKPFSGTLTDVVAGGTAQFMRPNPVAKEKTVLDGIES